MTFHFRVLEEQASRLAFAGLTLFFLTTTLVWLRLDRSPGHWDDSWYLTNSLILFDTLAENGLASYLRRFLTVLESKAPLITVLPTPLFLILGRSSRVAYLVNVGWMLILFAAVYRIGTRYQSRRAGLLAVYILGTMPLLYGLSRQYLVEFGLTALVALAICCLMESDFLQEPKKAFWLGVVCGFGLLMKVSFPLYVFAPVCFAFLKFLGVCRGFRQILGILCAAGLPTLLIPLAWYWRNYRKTLDQVFLSAFSPVADSYGKGDPFSLAVVLDYFVHWVSSGPSAYYILLATAFAAITLWSRGRRENWRSHEGMLFASLWFLPFLVFVFGRNKDIRFTAPLLPALALVIAWMADWLVSAQHRWRRMVVVLLFGFPLLAYLHTSFSLLGSVRLASANLVLLAPGLSYARPPDSHAWPHQEILEVLARNSRSFGKKSLMIGSDTPHFNANNLELAAVEMRYPFHVTTSAYESNLESLLNAANSTEFFIYKESGEKGPDFTNLFFKPLLEDVQTSGKFEELTVYPSLPRLPDGGKVIAYQNLWPNSAICEGYYFDPNGIHPRDIEMSSCDVNFDDSMKLTGFSFEIDNGWLKVSYRWRCLRKLDQDLFCFTHIMDEHGQLLGFLDHAILGESRISWEERYGASERLRYRLPQGVNQVRLRLGLFRPSTGKRLQVRQVRAAEGMSFSLADEGTAVFVRYHQ